MTRFNSAMSCVTSPVESRISLPDSFQAGSFGTIILGSPRPLRARYLIHSQSCPYPCLEPPLLRKAILRAVLQAAYAWHEHHLDSLAARAADFLSSAQLVSKSSRLLESHVEGRRSGSLAGVGRPAGSLVLSTYHR